MCNSCDVIPRINFGCKFHMSMGPTYCEKDMTYITQRKYQIVVDVSSLQTHKFFTSLHILYHLHFWPNDTKNTDIKEPTIHTTLQPFLVEISNCE